MSKRSTSLRWPLILFAGALLSSAFANIECASFLVAPERDDVDFLYAQIKEPDAIVHASGYSDYLQEQDDEIAQAKGRAIQHALTSVPTTGFTDFLKAFVSFGFRFSALDDWRSTLTELRKKAGWDNRTDYPFMIVANRYDFARCPTLAQVELQFHHGVPTQAFVSFVEMNPGVYPLDSAWILNNHAAQATGFLAGFLAQHTEISDIRVVNGDSQPYPHDPDLLDLFALRYPQAYVELLRRGHPGLLAHRRARTDGLKSGGPFLQ